MEAYLNNNQKERYKRNTILDKIGFSGQEKLLKSKVLVCGAGGLGSAVIVNLASSGIGNIGIVDNDIVELSNLNRQYIHNISSLGEDKIKSAKEWVKNFNPDIKTEIFKIHLNDKNYKDVVVGYDIIVDCFDSFNSKFLLNTIALDIGKPLVHGGVSEFQGQVMTILPKKSACLECIFPQGKEEFETRGVVSPAVSIIGSIQAFEVLKLVLNQDDLLINKVLFFDGLKMRFKIINIGQNKTCRCVT